MSYRQKFLDLKNINTKNTKDTIDNAPNSAGPLTGGANVTANSQADSAKTLAQDILDNPDYSSITPVLQTYSDDGRADTRAAQIYAWAGDADNEDLSGNDQEAADALYSIVQTTPDLKFAIDNGPQSPT